MRTLLLAAVLATGIPNLARAQVFEIELGGGYVFGGGLEDPAPSLPVFDVGAVLWPTARWGIAVRRVEGPGEDLLDKPNVGSDRTFLGKGHLRYWTVNARHRRTIAPERWGVEIGMGLLLGGEYATVMLFHDPSIGRLAAPNTFFPLGFSLEGLMRRQLSRHFGLKGGVTYDFNVETNNLQPIVLGTIRF